MTAPIRPTRQRLHAAIQLALKDLEADPSNDIARQAAVEALDGIRSWAQVEGPQQARQGALRDTEQATNPGTGMSALMGFGQGATFGLSDELSGVASAIPRMIPGGQSPVSAYAAGRDRSRAQIDAARAFHPGVTGVSDIVGSVAGGSVAVRGALGALPAAGRAIAAGGTAGASLGQKLMAALTGGAVGAAAGGLDAYGRGEEGPIKDLGRAGVGAAVGGALGMVGTGLGNRIARRSQVDAARELKAVNEGAASQLDLQRQQAQVAADEARARMLGIRATEAEAVAPARIQSAQNQAALSTERLQAQPTIRDRQTAAADRAQGAAERAGLREADRLQDLPVRREMMEYDRIIKQFRASNIGKMAGRPGSGMSREDALRRWGEQQGMSPDRIESSVAAMKRLEMPGGAASVAPEPTARPVSPETIQRTVVDPEAVVAPNMGTSVPEVGTMPGSPSQAASSAHALVEAAGGDATEAARRVAGFASDAVPTPPVPGLEEVAGQLGDAFQPVQRILMGQPTPEAQAALLQVIEGLDDIQRQVILRNLPASWRQALGGI